jgi:phosphate transport system ATP-binding protein
MNSGNNNSSGNQAVLKVEDVNVFYSSNSPAVSGVNLEIFKNQITAFIGPSGCGKSTILRCFNRLNDLIEGARVKGSITFNGHNLYDPKIDPVAVRRQIGMVFQRPNPFPKSIYENIAFGPRINGFKGSKTDMADLVEKSLRSAAIWDEVKDKLQESGLALSGGQQQRLCIARAIAVEPQVILMDEPCSALDPISTLRIEELMQELKQKYTLIIVTHNMQQASRSADMTAFFNTELTENGKRTGKLVEVDRTSVIFSSPKQTATEEYISGRFG